MRIKWRNPFYIYSQRPAIECITIGDEVIRFLGKISNLGVNLDYHMDFKAHITEVYRKA